jgi:hypothetical protein
MLIVALLVFTIFINLSWFDEELHPQLQALKTLQTVPMDDNAYPLLWGLAAADNKDPLMVGKAIVARQRALYQEGKKIEISADELSEYFGGQDLDAEWQDSYQSLSCNSRLSIDCASQSLDEVKPLGIVSERLRLVFQRYEQMLSQAHFQENQEGDIFSPLPSYGLVMNVARIYLSNKATNASSSEFIEAADQDRKFWLRMLRDGDYLIAKMVALAGIRNNLQMLSTLTRNGYFTTTELKQLSSIIQPLTEAERDIGETFLAEMRINILGWDYQGLAHGDPSWLEKLFTQKNATLNEVYLKIMLPVQLHATRTASEFYQQQGFKRQPFNVRAFPPDLYNLAGKMSLKESWAGYDIQDYVTRTHDVNGQISAFLLQLEVALNPDKGIQQIIQQSQHRNPYTQQPMDYDPQVKTLGFECLGKNSKDVCKVQL